MPYDATVLKVMIASPSDVCYERDAVREIIAEWNCVNSEAIGLVLLPHGWESHSSPFLGERPQGVINRQVLDGCDLLVGLFWTRLGSPTGEAVSGTVEEIDRHVAAGKPAMLYFSDVPVSPSKMDAKQHDGVKAFKAACYERGLVESYRSGHEFRAKFSRQLALTVYHRFGRPAVEFGPGWQPGEAAWKLLLAATKEFATGVIGKGADEPRGTIAELVEYGLVFDRFGDGEEYMVTDRGYVVAAGL